MSRPSSCVDCDFYSSCSSAMYMDGCKFYFPEDRKRSFWEIVRNFLVGTYSKQTS